MATESKKLITQLPKPLKEELEQMSDETGLAMTTLVNLAVHSLVANYKAKGSFIFADLLNPEHRQKG